MDSFLESGALISIEGNRLLLGFGEKQKSSLPKLGGTSFYFPDFFLTNKNCWHSFKETIEVTFDDLLKVLENREIERLTWSEGSKTFFTERFWEIKNQINRNQLYKAVPFVFDRAQGIWNRSRLNTSLYNLLTYAKVNPVHVYGFWDQDEGILGATPEILFVWDSKSKQRVHTVACAGTRKKEEQPEGLLSDPKELAEHRYVVEGIAHSLKFFGDVHYGNPRLIHLKHLCHLYAEIVLEMTQPFDFISLVNALHPTPALGAYPKDRGLLWLEQYEKLLRRKRFGAPVGFINEQMAKAYVAIRNIQWEKNQLSLGAGCGVVKESVLDKEWNEIRLKIHSIKEIFKI